MKKLCLMIVIMLFTFTSAAAANKPVRIARLPIIIQNISLDYQTSVTLEMKIARAVNIPMNKTLKIAEYLPLKTSEVALNSIWQKMYFQNKKAKISDAVKLLADDLNADLVVCPILKEYFQRQTNSGISTIVSAELIVFDKSTGKLIYKKDSRRFNDYYNKYGTASYLAGECFEQLIQDTGLRAILHSKRG